MGEQQCLYPRFEVRTRTQALAKHTPPDRFRSSNGVRLLLAHVQGAERGGWCERSDNDGSVGRPHFPQGEDRILLWGCGFEFLLEDLRVLPDDLLYRCQIGRASCRER